MNNKQMPDYCVINSKNVILNGKIIFTCGDNQGEEPLLNSIYKSAGINYPKFYKMDNLSKTGYLASEYLLRNTSFDTAELKHDTAVVLMNRNASLDTDMNFQKTISDPSGYFPSPSIFVYTLPNIMLGEICIRFKISGEGIVFISREMENDLFYDYIARLFTDNKTRNCIFGWVDYFNGIPEAFLSVIKKESFSNFDNYTFNEFIKSSFSL